MNNKYFLWILIVMILFCFSCVHSPRGIDRTKPVVNKNNTNKTRIDDRNKNGNNNEIHSSKKTMSGSEIFERYNSAVFMIFTSDGYSDFQGSGFFIDSKGTAVSNYHVFKGTNIGYELIKLSNGKVYKINKVIAYDEQDDIFIFEIKSNGESFNYIPINRQLPKIGESVYAIGSPRGLENTFSSGEISQFRDDNMIQINVPIDHGSSGGALINSFGEVVGITTAGLDYSGANLNFAISIKVIDNYYFPGY